MDRKNEKAIMGVFKQFESWRGGKTCKTGAPCAMDLLGQMGLSPFQASDLLFLFHKLGNHCLGEMGICDLAIEMPNSWPEDSEEKRGQ